MGLLRKINLIEANALVTRFQHMGTNLQRCTWAHPWLPFSSAGPEGDLRLGALWPHEARLARRQQRPQHGLPLQLHQQNLGQISAFLQGHQKSESSIELSVLQTPVDLLDPCFQVTEETYATGHHIYNLDRILSRNYPSRTFLLARALSTGSLNTRVADCRWQLSDGRHFY